MKYCILIVGLALIAVAVVAQDDAAPDFASLDKDALVILARNQHRRITQLEAQVGEMTGKMEAADIKILMTGREVKAAAEQAETIKAEMAKLQAFIDGDPKLKAKLAKQQEIEQAIGEHRIVVGMTLEEANRAMGYEGKMIANDQYEWRGYLDDRLTIDDMYPPTHTGMGAVERGSATAVRVENRAREKARLSDRWQNKSTAHCIAEVEDGCVSSVAILD